MMSLITVNEAAVLLGLNPQTIYRKVSRGELKGVRLGRTIRFDPSELLALTSAPANIRGPTVYTVPSFVEPLFWDVRASDLTASNPLVIERVLDLGDVAQARWLLTHQRPGVLMAFLHSRRGARLSSRSRNFWFNYFGLDNEEKDLSTSAEKRLGETGWR